MRRPDSHVAAGMTDTKSDDDMSHQLSTRLQLTPSPPPVDEIPDDDAVITTPILPQLDPNHTHKGHVIVCNNGGPRQVVSLAEFHPPPRETAAPPPPFLRWETADEPDDDEMEAAWLND
jgi:hypothetical protein